MTGWNDPDIIGSVGLSYRMSDQASDVVDWYLQPTTPACHFPEPGGLQASGDAEGHATKSSCDTVYAPQPPERIRHSHER